MSDDGPDATTGDGEPVEVPATALSEEALHGLIEAFVLQEGTEYGEHEVPLPAKVAQVRRQLERGEARIVFDPRTGTAHLMPVR